MSQPPLNPYRAPSAHVQDVREPEGPVHFAAPARKVDAGNGASWIGEGWALFKAAPLLWIVALLLLGGLYALVSRIPELGEVLLVVFGAVPMVGMLAFAKGIADNGEANIGHLFVGLRDKLGALVLVSLLNFLLFMGALVVVGGLALVLVGSSVFAGMASPEQFAEALFAGAVGLSLLLLLLVFLALTMLITAAYWFAPGLVFFAGLGVVDAFKQSFAACLRNWLPFLIYGLLGCLVLMAGTLALGIGLLVALPVLMASYYVSFRDLFGQQV